MASLTAPDRSGEAIGRAADTAAVIRVTNALE